MPRPKKENKDKKSKIQFDINENLLKEFDKSIEGQKRSRVIEELLSKYIEENKNKLD